MKQLIVILLLPFVVLSASAEKLDDRFVMRNTDKGLLFFIFPYPVPSTSKEKDAEFDVTYLLSSDSVTLNISVRHKSMLAADSLCLTNQKLYLNPEFSTFFIDKADKSFRHRYSLSILYSDFEKLYNQETPFKFSVYSQDKVLSFAYPAKKWEKEKGTMSAILNIINTNKRLSRSTK